MHLQARQRGFALLGLLALISLGVIFAYVTGLNRSAADMAQARAQTTATALAQAKEALIAYAVTYADDPSHTANPVPGFLPCPEMVATINNEGVETSGCGSRFVSQLGRLPWRTLGLGPVMDGSYECLWYAVSGIYKNSPSSAITTSTATSYMMNWDTNGQFNVMASDGATYLAGSAADNRAVAVVFAPGAALGAQNRTPNANAPACRGSYSAAAYLETTAGINNSVVSATANAIDTYIAGNSSSTFNDQLVYITRADIWNAVKKRSDFQNNLRALTRRAAECVAMYGTENNHGASDKRLPWASNVSLSDYVVDSTFRDTSGNLSGRLPYRVSVSAPGSGTNNSISSPYYLFAAWPGSDCSYSLSPVNEQVWYDHWKDHLFYAIANNYRPVSANKPTAACGTCLKIEGVGSYAAVVIFAGEKLSGLSPPQSRNTTAEKAVITNYLEGRNASNDPNAGGNSNYQAVGAIGTFNDILYAIDTNLRVQCYSTASSAMVLQNSTPQTGIPASAPAPLSPPGAPNLPPGPVGPYAACP